MAALDVLVAIFWRAWAIAWVVWSVDHGIWYIPVGLGLVIAGAWAHELIRRRRGHP